MNSTYTFAILLIPLLVITPTLVFATNNSDYKYGFKNGFEGYKCASDNPDCDFPSSESPIYDLCTKDNKITNMTACTDGYVNGWETFCKAHIDGCLYNILYGYFPDIHEVLKSSCLIETFKKNATTGLFDSTIHYKCGDYIPS
jgi:hypothetical protein